MHICIISTCLPHCRHRALTKWSVDGCVFKLFIFGVFVLSFWVLFLLTWVSVWCHFDVILHHFEVLGSYLASLGSPGESQRGRVEEMMTKLVRWRSFGCPKEFQWEPILDIFYDCFRFSNSFFYNSFLKASGVSGDPHPTMKMMVSCIRNHHFQMSTSTPKMTGNGFPWTSLWEALGSKMPKMKVQKQIGMRCLSSSSSSKTLIRKLSFLIILIK